MTKFFLNRPKALFSLYAIITILGITSIVKLPVELYPEVSYPSLQISVGWNDASPELIEKSITRKIESEIFKLEGVRNVQSRSMRGRCNIEVEFESSVDMSYQKVLLSEAISHIELPSEARSPVIEDNYPDEFEKSVPVVISITGPYSLDSMGEIGKEIKLLIERVKGVKKVDLYGDPEITLNIRVTDPTINPYFVAREFFTFDEAVNDIEINGVNISVTLDHPIYPEEMFIEGKPLDEIAVVELSSEEPFWISRINGNPSLTLNIEKRVDIGLLDFSNNIQRAISEMDIDEAVIVEITKDNADDIRDNMKNLGLVALIAIIGVSLTFLFTMKSRFSVFVFFLSIIFSSLITVILMYFTKLSLNVLTMSGIALGFGLVVDNSIIVLENILRLKEEGVKDPEKNAAREVFLPVLASTLTTISVFIPFIFFQGETRQFYIPFALSASFTLLSSVFVSFTITPTLAKKLKPVISYRPKIYEWILSKMIKLRYVVIPLTLILIAGGFYIFKNYVHKGSLMSYWGEDDEINIYIILPSGSEKAEVLRVAELFENEIKKHKCYENFYTRIYGRTAYIEIDFDRPTESAMILREQIQRLATNFANCHIRIIGMGEPFWTGSGFSGFPQFTIKGYDYYKLQQLSERLKVKLEDHPRIANVDINFSWRGKQKEFIVSPEITMILYGLHPTYVANVLRQKISFPLITEEQTYKLNIFRDSLLEKTELMSLPVMEGVELGDICSIEENISQGMIERENQQYTKAIAYDFQGPYKMVENFKIAFLNSIDLPVGFSIGGFEFGREEEGLNKKDIIIALSLALFLLLAILSSLYESLKKPFLILLVLPLSFFGVALVYFIFDKIFDSSAFIGLILLLGIAVNDGIVLIDHLSKGKKQDLDEIIKRAGHRFRPILITTITTIVGLLPFAFMESEVLVFSKLSISCLGGLVFSTIGSLFILPVFYYTFFRKKEKDSEQCQKQ